MAAGAARKARQRAGRGRPGEAVREAAAGARRLLAGTQELRSAASECAIGGGPRDGVWGRGE